MKQVNSMGMLLDEWKHKSCIAMIGTGKDFATIYMISSNEQRKGHATELLIAMQKYYENQGKVFGSSIALNDKMSRLLKKLDIIKYK